MSIDTFTIVKNFINGRFFKSKSGEIKPRIFAALILLCIAGVSHWIYFFNFGSITFLTNDWSKEYSYYYILQQALINHSIPYHISQAIQGTNRFLAIPETNLFPTIIVLPFLSIGKFVLFHILVMYSLGFIGCIKIMKKYNLSFLPFTFLFLLFNFNGYITAHLSVGHSMWSGYFLLPLFFYFVLEVLENSGDTFIVLKLAVVLFLILLTGAVHIFIWCIMLLLLIALFHWKYIKSVIYCIGISIILGLFRLAPAFITFKGGDGRFETGYNSLLNFINALVTIKPITTFRRINTFTIGWWEFDIYVSFIGVMFLLIFGVYFTYKNYKTLTPAIKYLILPIVVITLFSLGNIFGFIASHTIHLLEYERAPCRFIIPLLFLSIMFSIQLQSFLTRTGNKWMMQVFFYFILLIIGALLLEHSIIWRVKAFEKFLVYKNPYLTNIHIVFVNYDMLYKIVVQISFLISAIAVLIVIASLIRCFPESFLIKRQSYNRTPSK